MALNTFSPPRQPTSQGVQRQIRVLSNPFGDGYEQVSPDGLNPEYRTLSLRWENLRPAQATAISNFFSTQKSQPFLWQSPYDSATTKWRCTQWTEDQRTTVVNISAEFKEVFA